MVKANTQQQDNWWWFPGGAIVVSVVLLLFCLFYNYVFVFLAPYPGFDFKPGDDAWEVIGVDSCDERPAWCAANPGSIRVGDRITAIGDLKAEGAAGDWRAVPFSGTRPGDLVDIHLQQNGSEQQIPWLMPPVRTVDRFQRLASVLFFVPFWLAGTAVLLFLRPWDRRRRLFVAFNYLTAACLVVGFVSPFKVAASSLLLRVMSWFLIPVYLRLHLMIPKPVISQRSRKFLYSLYGISAVLSVFEIGQILPPDSFQIGIVISVLGSLVILLVRLVGQRPSWEKPVLRLMLAGILLSFGPIVGLMIGSELLSGFDPGALITSLSLLAIPILPLFYTYAFYKQKLGDLEFRANRVLSWYAFLLLYVTAFVLAYGLVTWVVNTFGRGMIFFATMTMTVIFVVGAGALRPRFQRLVDRLAYGVRYNPDELVRVFARRIPAALEREEMVSLITGEIMPTLFVRQSAIYLLEEGEVQPFYTQNVGAALAPTSVAEVEQLLDTAGQYRPVPERPSGKFDWVRLVIPLRTRHTAIGVWLFGRRDPDDYYPQQEIELLSTLANQIAPVLENLRLLDEKTKQLRLAQTLQKVGALLTASLSLDQVFEQIFALLDQVVDYDSVSIQLFDESGKPTFAAGKGFPDVKAVKELVASFPEHADKVIPDERPVLVIPDTHADERWIVHEETSYIRSWVGASLQVKGRQIGILNVDSATVNAYDATDAETITAFAHQAATALENARLHQETEERARELSVLHRAALAMVTVVDVDDLIEQTTEMIAENLPYDSFGFLTVEEWSGRLFAHPSYHGVPDEFFDAVIPLRGSLAGRVVREAEPVLIPDVTVEPEYHMILPEVRSLVSVPVMVQQQVVGLLDALGFRKNMFTENDLRFLTTLAGQLGAAIERGQLYDTMQRNADRLSGKVTEQTAELRAERDRTQAILDNAGEGIFLASPTGIVLYANRSAAKLTGWETVEILGQELLTWLGDAVADHVQEQIEIAIEEDQGWSGEIAGKRKNGGTYEVNLTLVPIHDTEMGLSGYVGVQADISRLKELERLRTELVANVSHEFRTPLTNIRTYTSLLRWGSAEDRDRYLDVLAAETERLSVLIRDLLDVSQLEAIRAELRPAALPPLLEDVVQSMAFRAREKGVELVVDIPAGLPVVLADVSQLDRAVSNLLRNAITYTPAPGRVTVKAGTQTQAGQERVWIAVADTGPGIAPEDLPHIFDRFYRGQDTREGGIPGTGLGLAISKEIVIRHNGRLSVDNRPGEGATFIIWLPAGEEEMLL